MNHDMEAPPHDSHATISLPSLSTPQRFHHDGFHSIFRYLNITELMAVAQSCQSWLAAVSSSSLPSTVSLHPSSLRQLLSSRCRHIVRQLDVRDTITLQQLRKVCAELSSLSSLHVTVDIGGVRRVPKPIAFPKKLTSLSIELVLVGHGQIHQMVRTIQQAVIDSCFDVQTLTSLSLTLTYKEVWVNWQGLRQLKNLKELTIRSVD